MTVRAVYGHDTAKPSNPRRSQASTWPPCGCAQAPWTPPPQPSAPSCHCPPAQRISPLNNRLRLVRTELAAPAFRGSPQARELDEQVEEFSRDSATAGLHGLSPGPA